MCEQKTVELKIELAKVLGCKEGAILLRLKALELAKTCGRCGGGGNYSYCQMHGTTCFGCGGQGVVLPKMSKKLIDSARQAVADGKLKPYLKMLDDRAAAKKISSRLLDDYSSLSKKEKELVAADGRRGWHIGTALGFSTRHVAHVFLQEAQTAASTAQYSKSDAERAKASRWLVIVHAEMMKSPELLPAGIDGDIVIDSFESRTWDHNELGRIARGRLDQIRKEFEAAEAAGK